MMSLLSMGPGWALDVALLAVEGALATGFCCSGNEILLNENKHLALKHQKKSFIWNINNKVIIYAYKTFSPPILNLL